MELDRIIAVRTDKIVYRDGALAIKVFGRDYPKTAVLREALNQSVAEEAYLPVPAVQEITQIDGRWALVSDYIAGGSLCARLRQHPDRAKELLTRLAALQLKVQAQSCPGLPELTSLLARRIAVADLDPKIKAAAGAALSTLPKGQGLYHGNFEPSNIVCSGRDEFYILDWPNAAQGSVCADAAGTCLSLELENDVPSAALYLDLFCQASGVQKREVEAWLPVLAAAKLAFCRLSERPFLLHRAETAVVDKE